MTKIMNTPDRRTVLAALGTGLLTSELARAQSNDAVGAVQEVKGEAFSDRNDKRRKLEAAAPLFLNEIVSTGQDARLVLHLGTDTTLRLGALAKLTIDRLLVGAGGDITLQSGPILF